MRLYLDTCAWCRPFDEPDEKISREADALVKIIKKFDDGKFEIISSSALLAESSFISSDFITVDDGVLNTAECLKKYMDVRNPVEII